MTYHCSAIKLFGVLFALISAVNPLVATADCKESPLKVDPNTCCQIPNIFTEEVEEKCKRFTNQISTNPPASDSFNSDEFSSSPHHGHHRRRPVVSCFMSCVLNETGILTASEAKLNEEKLSAYLELALVNDTDMLPVIETSFKTCAVEVEKMRQQFKELRQKKDPAPNTVTTNALTTMLQDRMLRPRRCPMSVDHLMRCVFKETLINCPANKWSNTSSECNELRERLEDCKPPTLNGKTKDLNATEEM